MLYTGVCVFPGFGSLNRRPRPIIQNFQKSEEIKVNEHFLEQNVAELFLTKVPGVGTEIEFPGLTFFFSGCFMLKMEFNYCTLVPYFIHCESPRNLFLVFFFLESHNNQLSGVVSCLLSMLSSSS